jgi:hypothetical protein
MASVIGVVSTSGSRMSHRPPDTEKQASPKESAAPRMVIFDAPADLMHAFLENGFRPHGRQPGAWSRPFSNPKSAEARDLEYEIAGVGMTVKWWTPPR